MVEDAAAHTSLSLSLSLHTHTSSFDLRLGSPSPLYSSISLPSLLDRFGAGREFAVDVDDETSFGLWEERRGAFFCLSGCPIIQATAAGTVVQAPNAKKERDQ